MGGLLLRGGGGGGCAGSDPEHGGPEPQARRLLQKKCSTMTFLSILKSGKVIGLPTDTVYGLAADARLDAAVAEIYALKSRPSFNPLIIHIHDLQQAQLYGEFNEDALQLAQHFWAPSQTASALTIVVPYKKDSGISSLALAGLDTIALRVPNHPLALKVLAEFGGPLAAPSANPSNSLSPTTAEHVRQAFPGLPVLDGGSCEIGIESTIVWCSGSGVVLLRPGIVTKEEMDRLCQPGQVAKRRDPGSSATSSNSKNMPFVGCSSDFSKRPEIPALTSPKCCASRTCNGRDDNIVRAPGSLKKHYAPKTPMVMNVTIPSPGDIYVGFGSVYPSAINLSQKGDLKEAAANLFRCLHQVDQLNALRIAIAPIPNEGIGLAINDRLSRGCQ